MPRFQPRPVRQLEDRSTPDAGTGVAVSGLVYADLNGNGALDAGETGLGGVTLRLDLAGNGTVDATTTTDDTGYFTFADVTAGVHAVILVPPSGTATVGPATRAVTVGTADVGGLNIGLRSIGAVTGTVYADLDGDGTKDAGEPGLAGVTVAFDAGADGTVEFTATSAADGTYQFTGVPNGIHTVTALAPTDYLATTTNPMTVIVGSGTQTGVADVGFEPVTGVAGRVTMGLSGAGLAGVKVQFDAFGDGTIDQTATTDKTGAYYFANVPGGAHVVSVDAPPGTTYDTPTGTSKQTVAVTSGAVTGINFGLTYPGGVTGGVFLDLNGNGKRDEGEAAIQPGRVQIDLNNSGVLVDVTAKAMPDGTFAVTGLPEGTHALVVTPPGGYAASGFTRSPFTIAAGEVGTVTATGVRPTVGSSLALGSNSAAGATVYTFNPGPNGTVTAVAGRTVALPGANGSRLVTADFNGDGTDDVITATGPGEQAAVRVYDGKTGVLWMSTEVFEIGFRGGLNLAAGDFNADGKADVVVAADNGGGARVQVLNAAQFLPGADPAQGKVLVNFFGIEDAKFRGGARVAVGDLNGDGVLDLVVSAGQGGGPRVAVFDGTSVRPGGAPARLVSDFFVFESRLRNGAVVAVGDVNGDGRPDLVAGAGPGGAPRVSVFSGYGVMAGQGADAPRVADFFVAGNATSRAGTQLAVKDVDHDGRADVVASVGSKAFVYTSAGISNYYVHPVGMAPTAAAVLDPFTNTTGVFLG